MPDASLDQNNWVERVLGLRLSGAAPRGDGRAGVRLTQALMVWNATRIDTRKQIEALQAAVLSTAKDEEDYVDILANIGNLDAVMERLDDSLGAKLSEIRTTPDPAEKARLSGEARKLVQALQGFVETDTLLADMNAGNGFMDLGVKPKLQTALAAMLDII